MRVTIVKDDKIVGVDGLFRTVDMAGLPANIRVVQWDGTKGHIEYTDMTNAPINSILAFQSFIDRWNAAAPQPPSPPTQAEMIQAAHDRINTAYELNILIMLNGYPPHEISSWDKQEAEARAWVADNSTATPWIDAAATARGITKADFIAKVIAQADAVAPMHGTLTGKRQNLRDQIDALTNPTQQQLDSIKW